MPELVNNHITTHDIPRNSYSVPVRARRSVTVESVVVTCAFDGDQILLFRFCGGWFLRAGRKRAPKYSYSYYVAKCPGRRYSLTSDTPDAFPLFANIEKGLNNYSAKSTWLVGTLCVDSTDPFAKKSPRAHTLAPF